MTIWAVYCAQPNRTGMIWSKYLLIAKPLYAYFCLSSNRVRIKIRDGHSDFAVTNASWPSFCYPYNKQCSSQDIKKGLFREELLVKVMYHLYSINHKFVLMFLFRHSSTSLCLLRQLQKIPVIFQMRFQLQSDITSSDLQLTPMLHHSVASITPCSIASIAVQVCPTISWLLISLTCCVVALCCIQCQQLVPGLQQI